MVQNAEELTVRKWKNSEGTDSYFLTDLTNFVEKNPKLRLYAHVRVLPGEEVAYHVHFGECEYYYFLSGKGLYRDNDNEYVAEAGTITLTTSGNGHGVRNIGEDCLEFMALVLVD